MATMETDQRNALILTGAAWSWLLTRQNLHQLEVTAAALMLSSLMLLFMWRWHHLHRGTQTNATYLRDIEAALEAGALGWETWLHERRKIRTNTLSLKIPTVTFWSMLVVVNLGPVLLYEFMPWPSTKTSGAVPTGSMAPVTSPAR